MELGKKVKHKTKKLVDSKHMLKGITLASFLESTIVPIPLESVMVPLIQARRSRFGNCINGHHRLCDWRSSAMPLVTFRYGWSVAYRYFFSQDQFDSVKQQMQNQGFWFIMTLGIAPIPFQVAMLAAGATQYSLPLFLLATAVAFNSLFRTRSRGLLRRRQS